MAKDPTFIRSIAIEGFRAYLDLRTFDFSKQRSLAVFAPNGFGKSSLVDALEFLFSEDGTLARLGLRTIHNKAGFAALEHDKAKDRKISPNVTVTFRAGKEDGVAARPAIGSKRERPPIAAEVRGRCAVDPIIRGYQLRSFVEQETAEARYESVAHWLQLGPLVESQKNLRLLRQQAKAAAEDQHPFDRLNAQLSKETSEAVKAWSLPDILSFANKAILQPLDAALECEVLLPTDAAVVTVAERAKAEEKRLGVEGLRQIRSALGALHDETTDPETQTVTASGLILGFLDAIAARARTAKVLSDERAAAADAVFSAVWQEAEPLFANPTNAPEYCPLCTTPIENSTAGSPEAIQQHLQTHLAALKNYAAAKIADDETETALLKAHTRLSTGLKSLSLPDEFGEVRTKIQALQASVDSWAGDSIDGRNVIAAVLSTLADIDTRIKVIIKKQGDHTYIQANAKLDRLLELAVEQALATRTQDELAKLSEALTRQSNFVSSRIRAKVQTLLNSLQTPINALYAGIQGAGAAAIRLELPPEDDTNQQRLNLLIDFSPDRVGVQPGGYLSDSQIHSLALALRLSAIRTFNTAVPFVVLDDIVTSYDADHRRMIAALLATEFQSFQVIVTTHDERFYLCLKDQQSATDWRFCRIKALDRDYGPRLADERISDDMILDRWVSNESAANEMRKAEEEWLLVICREFGVSIRIRQLERAYQYDRGELASALAAYLNTQKLTPPLVPGVNNRFLASLQQGVVENFGSHFQEGPYGDGSIGDEKARWAEFVAFRKYFSCPSCKRRKFKRPNELKKPVCAHETCEAQFAFTPPLSTTID